MRRVLRFPASTGRTTPGPWLKLVAARCRFTACGHVTCNKHMQSHLQDDVQYAGLTDASTSYKKPLDALCMKLTVAESDKDCLQLTAAQHNVR
jgi:hypothetical protein